MPDYSGVSLLSTLSSCGIPLMSGRDGEVASGGVAASSRHRASSGDTAPGEGAVFFFFLALHGFRAAASADASGLQLLDQLDQLPPPQYKNLLQLLELAAAAAGT